MTSAMCNRCGTIYPNGTATTYQTQGGAPVQGVTGSGNQLNQATIKDCFVCGQGVIGGFT